MVEGFNANARAQKLSEFEGGDLHLIGGGDTMNDTDGDTELQNKSDAVITTSGTDWTQNEDNTAGTTTLTNTVDLDFGAVNIGTTKEAVLESAVTPGEFIISDVQNDPTVDGENFSVDAGDFTHTLGGE